MKKEAKLTLVGAGPGDPELISIKGAKTLASADVVLYDALVHPDILNYAPESSPKIFVGKKPEAHSFKQDEINLLIMENALKHGHVVRLKGGDPFVFGRGQEEIEYAEAFNIKTAMVPGISSSISVPALQGIPVTRRHTSESFWVLTGTTKAGELSEDISLAAQSTATLVILMGTRKLEQIAEIFKSIGKENIPVAVIQNGSLENEKIAIGTIANIAHLVKEKAISSPAVIVIGEVVKYHPEFNYEFVEKNYLS